MSLVGKLALSGNSNMLRLFLVFLSRTSRVRFSSVACHHALTQIYPGAPQAREQSLRIMDRCELATVGLGVSEFRYRWIWQLLISQYR